MTIEAIRTICRSLPEVTEDVKWGHDLCFCFAGKVFARLGDAFERRELEPLLKTSYDLVVARLPKSRRPGAAPVRSPRRGAPKRSRVRRRR